MARRALRKPRTKPVEVRRGDLLEAAQRLFLKDGVAAVSVEEITDAAKVSKGSFYSHFSSKEALIAALAGQFSQTLLKSLQAAVAEPSEKDWKGKLAAWASACVSGYLDAAALHELLFFGSAHAGTRDGLVDNILIDHLAALLSAGKKAGVFSLEDVRVTAVFLFNGAHAAIDDAQLREKRVNRMWLSGRLGQLFLSCV